MYVTSSNCVNVSFSFNKQKVAEIALLDSDATDNFIDQRTVEQLHLTMHRLPRPHILYNVDKTENKSGRITKYINLEITRGLQV